MVIVVVVVVVATVVVVLGATVVVVVPDEVPLEGTDEEFFVDAEVLGAVVDGDVLEGRVVEGRVVVVPPADGPFEDRWIRVNTTPTITTIPAVALTILSVFEPRLRRCLGIARPKYERIVSFGTAPGYRADLSWRGDPRQ